MWGTLISSIGGLFTSWIDVKKEKYKAEAALHMKLAQAEADWDLVAQQQAQYSWKDEFITIIWFTPLVVAWFDPVNALAWVQFVDSMPYWYQFGMFGIIAASFGLRWMMKNKLTERKVI
jgi:hypothetical protein